MRKRLTGKATERIPYGALVLCRNGAVSLAPPETANAVADAKPSWAASEKGYHHKGDWIGATAIEGLGARDLHAIAAGPIMEPLAIYLPAGKVTEAEYQERLDLQFREAGITRP